MDLNCPIVSESYKTDRRKLLIEHESTHATFLCSSFLLLRSIEFRQQNFTQIFFMGSFLDGEFRTYGLDVLRFTQMEPEDRINPESKIFPKVTKCTFHKYGASGKTLRPAAQHF